MSRVWLAALGAAAVIACGGDDDGNGPTDFFPDVAGVYDVEGQFDGADPNDFSFSGTVTIEQESLESSLLTGTADFTIISPSGNTTINDAELLNAGVDLGGNVAFTLEQGAVTSWDFVGERGRRPQRNSRPHPGHRDLHRHLERLALDRTLRTGVPDALFAVADNWQ